MELEITLRESSAWTWRLKPWASVAEVTQGAEKGHLRTDAEVPAALSGLMKRAYPVEGPGDSHLGGVGCQESNLKSRPPCTSHAVFGLTGHMSPRIIVLLLHFWLACLLTFSLCIPFPTLECSHGGGQGLSYFVCLCILSSQCAHQVIFMCLSE